MELKERYVYAVVSKLPEKQREEIAKEVNLLIEDMMDAIVGGNDEEKLEKVLLELGNPSELANKYREEARFLIGPKYFYSYLYTLKIVAIVILVVHSISAIFSVFSNKFLTIITNYIPDMMNSFIYSFAWVTLLFAIFEYAKVDLNGDKGKWTPKQLAPVPNKKAKISRSETIVGIVFSTIFLVLFYSELFAIIVTNPNGGIEVIPIFIYDQLSYFKTLIIVIFLIGIAKEIVKLIYGRWNLTLSVYYSILSVVSAILSVILFSNTSVWNTNFIQDVVNHFSDTTVVIPFDINEIISFIVGIIIFGTLIDIGTALYKGIKYDHKKSY